MSKAKAKSNVKIDDLINKFNDRILKGNTREIRLEICYLLEDILLDSNRYKGYTIRKNDGSYLNGSPVTDDSYRQYL